MKSPFVVLTILSFITSGLDAKAEALTVRAGVFEQEISSFYHVEQGLPGNETYAVELDSDGAVFAGTAKGLARFGSGRWTIVENIPADPVLCLTHGIDGLYAATGNALYRVGHGIVARLPSVPTALAAGNATVWVGSDQGLHCLRNGQFEAVAGLNDLLGEECQIRQIALGTSGQVVVAAKAGLFDEAGGAWQRLLPHTGDTSWAVRDARGVIYDRSARLWSASPQGVARSDGAWALFTGREGLPYNDFTLAAPGEDGVVWFGTKIGAIRYDGGHWAYREGKRWLPNNNVRDIAVTSEGHAWFATADGVGLIERRPMTLAKKALFYEEEIDKYHRRTPYEYVLDVHLPRPGDKSEWRQRDDDNDGQWTGMYGAGECFAYAATKDPKAKRRATAAFEGLRFFSQVTQGGSHPAPKGFPARTILPTSGPRNPNQEETYSIAADERRRDTSDGLWKVIHPRWPTSEDGKWYWKCDTSSDELDGHYFLNARYYDLVAETEQEKERVRQVVRDMTDHLIEHDFRLVDHDGQPTRWANFSPESLNHDPNWWPERGLNSLSILSYLRTAEHITGDSKYARAADTLVRDHAYAMNVMYPKHQRGPGSYVQFDDEMAFMNYYNLLLYETDPDLRELYAVSCREYWELEACERNAFYNFTLAACCLGMTFKSPWGVRDLSPDESCLTDAVETLERYPWNLVNWKLTNRHRTDVIALSGLVRDPSEIEGMGGRTNGEVVPVDERYLTHWGADPWILDTGGEGTQLATGAPFLLAYYMGLHHGFIVEE